MPHMKQTAPAGRNNLPRALVIALSAAFAPAVFGQQVTFAPYLPRTQTPVFSFIVAGDEGFFPIVPNPNPAIIVDYAARIAHLMYNAANLSLPGAPRLPAGDLILNTGDNVYNVGSEDNYRD